MYVVEYMVNSSTNVLYNPCGSDYCVIINDLKTLRGVENRLKNYTKPKSAKEVRIYSTTNIFNRDSYVLLKTKSLVEYKECLVCV